MATCTKNKERVMATHCIAEEEKSAGAHSGRTVISAPAASVAVDTMPHISKYEAARMAGSAMGDCITERQTVSRVGVISEK